MIDAKTRRPPAITHPSCDSASRDGATGMDRRAFIAVMASVALTGCASTQESTRPIPAVDVSNLDRRLWRQVVDYPTTERVGTLVVDTPAKYLYLVMEEGTAMRYGIGVGRGGFSWSGRATIAYKRKWPTWTPPAEMIKREPELAPYSAANGGMPPSLDNPLGARALYIFQDGRDTLYRLHGTNQAWSIGKAVSSGCIRLLNQDVIDLYGRVPDGTPIRVIPDPATAMSA